VKLTGDQLMLSRFISFVKTHTTLELAILSAFLIIVGVLAADIGIVLTGDYNDATACRDAATLAAHSANASAALDLAQATVMLRHKPSSPIILDVSHFVYEDYGGQPPANAIPFVSVSTSSQVHVPAPIFFNTKIVGTDGNITFTHRCKMPLSRSRS